MSDKKINYKVMAAFSSFILAIASLVTVTLAWYEFSNAVQVDNLSYSIYDEEGVLQLGLKAPANLLSSLKEKYIDDGVSNGENGQWVDDIYYFTNSEHQINTDVLSDFGQYSVDTKLEPITNAYYDDWFSGATNFEATKPVYSKMPTLLDKGGKTLVTREEQKNFYYEFEFYVRASSVPVFVFLSNKMKVVPDTVKNAQKAEVSSYTEEQLNNVANYIRIGFFSELHYEDTINGKTYNQLTYNVFDSNPTYVDDKLERTKYYGRLDSDPLDGYYDVEGSISNDTIKKNEILYGRFTLSNGASLVYSEEARVSGLEKHELVGGFFANSWENANPIDIEKSKELNGENLVLYEENALDPSRTTSASNNPYKRVDNALCYVSRTEAQKVIITLWAEGWDLDCSRFSSDANFIANIIFNGKDENNLDKWGS